MPLMLSKYVWVVGRFSGEKILLITGKAQNVCFDSTCSVQFTRVQNLPVYSVLQIGKTRVKHKTTKRIRIPPKHFSRYPFILLKYSSRWILFFPRNPNPHNHQHTNIQPWFVAKPKAQQVPACHPAIGLWIIFKFFINTRLKSSRY